MRVSPYIATLASACCLITACSSPRQGPPVDAAPAQSTATPSALASSLTAPTLERTPTPTPTVVTQTVTASASTTSPATPSTRVPSPTRRVPVPTRTTTAPVQPSPNVLVTGDVNWVLFIGAQYVAGGYSAYCAASNGEVGIENGTGSILANSESVPVTQHHTTDAQGDESFQCDARISITVPRQQSYRLQWTDNNDPASNPGCDNSKSSADSEHIPDNRTSKVTFPVISFTFLCT